MKKKPLNMKKRTLDMQAHIYAGDKYCSGLCKYRLLICTLFNKALDLDANGFIRCPQCLKAERIDHVVKLQKFREREA